jgi:hypothetical protein
MTRNRINSGRGWATGNALNFSILYHCNAEISTSTSSSLLLWLLLQHSHSKRQLCCDLHSSQFFCVMHDPYYAVYPQWHNYRYRIHNTVQGVTYSQQQIITELKRLKWIPLDKLKSCILYAIALSSRDRSISNYIILYSWIGSWFCRTPAADERIVYVLIGVAIGLLALFLYQTRSTWEQDGHPLDLRV